MLYDSSDSFDEEEGILKKALDVTLPEDFNPNKIPQTGEEYVQHVIYERSKCQVWLKADIDRSKFKDKQTLNVPQSHLVKHAPASVLPSIEWQDKTLDDFKNFRMYIHAKIDENASQVFSFDENSFLERTQTENPSFSELISYTQAAKIRMLQIICKFLVGLEPGAGISPEMGTWIYGILTLLEKPLSPDWCYTLREFAKKCLVLRSNLRPEAQQALYIPLNLFICIVGRFFDQKDLADN